MVHKFIILLTALLALGCSYGAGDGDQTKRQDQAFQDKLNTFATVEGTYNGEITTGSEKIPVQILVFHDWVKDKSQNLPPVLKLRYRQMDRVRADIIMDADYRQETGKLIATSSSADSSGVSFEGFANGNALTGTLIRGPGPYGQLKVDKFSAETFFSKDTDTDLMDRLREKYAAIQGTYIGDVKSKNGDVLFTIEIKIFYVAIVSETGTAIALRATYNIADEPNAIRKLLHVDYRTDLEPSYVFMSTPEGMRPSEGASQLDSGFMSIGASLKNGLLKGEIADYRGPVGTGFTAIKVK